MQEFLERGKVHRRIRSKSTVAPGPGAGQAAGGEAVACIRVRECGSVCEWVWLRVWVPVCVSGIRGDGRIVRVYARMCAQV